MSRESALGMLFYMHLEKHAFNVMMKDLFLALAVVCVQEFMPKDLDMVGGDGPAATHGVCIVFMMGPCLEPHVPWSAQAWSPMCHDWG